MSILRESGHKSKNYFREVKSMDHSLLAELGSYTHTHTHTHTHPVERCTVPGTHQVHGPFL